MLGCGGSQGVPSSAGEWGVCDPSDRRNHRTRPSILIEAETASPDPADNPAGQISTLLVDTTPDLRLQLADAGVRRLDGVIYTHAHADHLHGIDDLRPINKLMGAPIPIWATAQTIGEIQQRFGYAVQPALPGSSFHRPTLTPHLIGGPFKAAGIPIHPFNQDHGHSTSLGLRIGNFAYSTDVATLDEAAFEVLAGIEVWIVDCLRIAPHPTHSHLERTLSWIARLRPRRAILTHMDFSMDYRTLCEMLPAGVEPGFDGMEITL